MLKKGTAFVTSNERKSGWAVHGVVVGSFEATAGDCARASDGQLTDARHLSDALLRPNLSEGVALIGWPP
jgi:hypothetical protein